MEGAVMTIFFLPFFTVFEFFLVFSGELVVLYLVLYLRSNKQVVPICV